jgi:uncharacterized membrane protein YdjX (TVP38/TMEM64 family)
MYAGDYIYLGIKVIGIILGICIFYLVLRAAIRDGITQAYDQIKEKKKQH